MSNSFEQIKDANQLQQYLQKHAQGGTQAAAYVRNKNASPIANDYMGMKKLREGGSRSSTAGAPPLSERYGKRGKDHADM